MMTLSIDDFEFAKVLGTLVPPVKKDENTALVIEAIEGREEAFDALMNKYQNRIYRLLYFMVHHQEDALDLVQETFIKAYKSLARLRSPEAFYSWLARIAVNLAINSLKRRQRIRRCQETLAQEQKARVENPVEALERKELHERLMELIAALPAKQRAALVLCDIEGYSYKEIAEILKCRIGTVMSRIYYAREYIRQQLEAYNL